MRYWKTCYITCFIFVLIPLTLYGQEDVEQLQKLDKLMFSGRYFESKELYENLSETTTIPSDLELYYKFRMAQFLNKTDSVAYYLEQFIPHHYATFGEETLVFYSNLFDAYIELGDMDKALDTYLQMKRIWNESLTKTTTGGKEYEECSNTVNAYRLQGKLMLILGELDDNVDPSTTFQVVNALIGAGKEFEFVVLPNQRHTMGGAYGERKRRDFFIRHLQGLQTPDWNKEEKK